MRRRRTYGAGLSGLGLAVRRTLTKTVTKTVATLRRAWQRRRQLPPPPTVHPRKSPSSDTHPPLPFDFPE